MDSLTPARPDSVRPGTPVPFGAGMTPVVSLVNFSDPEDGFVWSIGPWCEMRFDLDLAVEEMGTSLELTLDANVFAAPPKLAGQSVFAYLNGQRIGSAWVTGRGPMTFQTAQATLLRQGNVLTLDVPNAVRPSSFGQADDRRLGLKVFSLVIRPLG